MLNHDMSLQGALISIGIVAHVTLSSLSISFPYFDQLEMANSLYQQFPDLWFDH